MIRKATHNDAEIIQNLVRPYAEKGQMLFRTLEDIREKISDFLVYETEDGVVGVCSLKYWDKLVEIRSLAVDPRYYRRGIGTGLIRECIEEASACGCESIFVLTYVVPLFEKLGFEVVEMSTLPMKIWNDCKACLHQDNCDETAMIRPLEPLENRALRNYPLKNPQRELYF